MEWTMLCYDGTEYTLPTPVAWRLNYGLGTPCDSVWVKTLWSAGQESRLADGTRLRVTEKGETLFFGVIDECETQWSPAGCVAEITGRGLQALLLGEPPARLEELMAVHRAIYGPARTDVAVPLAPGEVPPPSLFL